VLRFDAGGVLGSPVSLVHRHGASLDPVRQTSAHPHSVVLDRTGRRIVVADMGTDSIATYALDTNGALTLHDEWPVPAGSGPRHLAFVPSGDLLLVATELSNEVLSYGYDCDRGRAVAVGRTTVIGPGIVDGAGGDLRVHPDGRMLYVSSRVANEVAVVAIGSDGSLALVDRRSTEGDRPRALALDRGGALLLAGNEGSDTIVAFHIDRERGRLTSFGALVETPSPAWIEIDRRR
jgi:6-phosphogluconolactonase